MAFPPQSEKDFRRFFSDAVLVRGKELFRKGKVSVFEYTKNLITAEVEGSEDYVTQAGINDQYYCSCPSEIQPCKHVAAVLYAALSQSPQAEFDLNTHIQNLSPEDMRALLQRLLLKPQWRKEIITLLNVVSAQTPHAGALADLKDLLEEGDFIEQSEELGQAAMAELAALDPETCLAECEELLEELANYEPNDMAYEEAAENEEGMYWEDLLVEWKKAVYACFANASNALGRSDQGFDELFSLFPRTTDVWQGLLRLAQPSSRNQKRLWDAIQKLHNHYRIEYIDEFFEHLKTPEEHLAYLASRLTSAIDEYHYFDVLVRYQRQEEALVQAEKILAMHRVELEKRHVIRESQWKYGGLLDALQFLRQHSPRFEVLVFLFHISPSLPLYQELQHYPEFASIRSALIASVRNDYACFDILLYDKDETALEKFLKKYPEVRFAREVQDFMPKVAKKIFRHATEENIKLGSRSGYAQAAHYAREYMAVEDMELFRPWLEQILTENKRRPALQDEFSELRDDAGL